MSSSEHIEINVIQTKLAGGAEFQDGASALEKVKAILTAASTERNRIDSGPILSELGLHDFSLVDTKDTSHDSTLKSAITQHNEPDDDGSARDRRLDEGRSKNPLAAQFFEDKAVELAFSKGGGIADSIDLDRAIQEILHNKWCMGAHDTTDKDIRKDWDILIRAGVSEKDIHKIVEQAEEKNLPGGRSCLIG